LRQEWLSVSLAIHDCGNDEAFWSRRDDMKVAWQVMPGGGSGYLLCARAFLARGHTRNASPGKFGHGSGNSVGGIIVFDLPRYHAEKRITIGEIHQQFRICIPRNFTAILGRLKRDHGKGLTSREKHVPQITRSFFIED